MANKSIWISSILFTIILLALSLPSYHDYAFFRVPDESINFGSSDAARPRRVLLLTAHPDDECMFFAPTVLALTRGVEKATENAREAEEQERAIERPAEVYSLCLSSGDADGLGETRKRELEGSLDVLGVEAGRRWVLDEPFHDSITEFWDAQLIAEHVGSFIEENKINTILTFDEYGISSHPNHISLERGVRVLLTSRPRSNLRAFSLQTTALLPKYTGAAAAVFSKLEGSFCTVLPSLPFLQSFTMQSLPPSLEVLRILDCARYDDSTAEGSNRALFVSGVAEYVTALRAMREHRSQFVWFRWLYVSFSRYMWVNEWEEIVVE